MFPKTSRGALWWQAVSYVMVPLRWVVLGILWLRRAVRPQPRRPVPPPEDPLLLMPATKLAAAIRARQVTSEQVVGAYAKRVRQVDALLHAVADERLEAALADAREVDELLAAGKAPSQECCPLLGVPFTVKGSLAVKGLEHSGGQKARAGLLAERDAEAVRRLRAAGAIPLLVSRTPEFCMFTETHSPLAPSTLNPYDTRRTPGGSSGGEAALLGAAASVIGIGSDVSGSARVPALYCGVFGHKPSAGLVPDDCHLPVATNKEWTRNFSVSPMCRYATDLPVMLSVMSGPQADTLHLNVPVNLQKVRVFYMENDGGAATSEPVNPELVAVMHKVIASLAERKGIQARKVHIKGFRKSLQFTLGIMARAELMTEPMEIEMRKNLKLAMCKYVFGMLPHNAYIVLFYIMRQLAESIPKEKLNHLETQLAELLKEISDLLGNDGVLLYPTHPTPATYLLEQYIRILNLPYTGIFNALGLPATHCPTGLGSQGLPVGVQVIAGPNQDRLNLAIAQEVELAFGGWIPSR